MKALLLPLTLIQLVVTEPFFYEHPVNPKLHPKDMFPIQKSLRGYQKVRDLPPSGIVYLNRIKPMGDQNAGSFANGQSDQQLDRHTSTLNDRTIGRATGLQTGKPTVAHANNTHVIDDSAAPLSDFTPSHTESIRRTSSKELTSLNTEAPIHSEASETPIPSRIDFDAAVIPPLGATTTGTPTTRTTEPPTTTRSTTFTTETTTTTAASSTTEWNDFSKYIHTGSAPRKSTGWKIAVAKTSKRKELEVNNNKAEMSVEQLIARLKEEDKVRDEIFQNIPKHPKVATINLPKEMIEKNPKVATIDTQKYQFNFGKTSQVTRPPFRLVPLSRTAHIHVGQTVRTKTSEGRLIGLKKKKKAYKVTSGDARRKGADFDPWERMGQKI